MSVTQGQPPLHQPTVPAEAENEGGRVVLLLLLGMVLLFGGAYAAAYAYAGDNVPRGTTVAGVDIGGRTSGSAIAVLQRGLADRVAAPIRVTAGKATRSVTADEAGLSVNYAATVAEAGGGRSWAPGRLWDYYTGGQDLEPVVDVDTDQLHALLDDLQQDSGAEPVEGAIRFVHGEVRTTAARPGTEINPETAGAAFEAAFLTEDPRVTLELRPREPDVDQLDVQKALNDFANKAVSGPVRIDFGDAAIKLEPAEFTTAITMKAQDGALVPTVRTAVLKKVIDARLGEHGAPVDATVAIVDDVPTVVPDKPGVGYDVQKVADGLLATVVKDAGERTLQVKATVARAEFRTADAEALGITEQVSSFTTEFPYAEYRNINIGRAGELINGTVLKPGETFSLNDIVGERTRENGFTEGFIISDGIFAEDLGGGVSQMATTTFNAAFFAGMTDIEHKPHSLYIDRYPIGREATVAWGSVDMRFRNDTPHGVLVDVHVTPSTPSSNGVVTVRMFSTKYWDITTKTGTPYAYTDYKTRTIDTPGCHENSGSKGFQIDIWRYFRRAGSSELVKTEKMHTTYIPSDTVICTNPDHT